MEQASYLNEAKINYVPEMIDHKSSTTSSIRTGSTITKPDVNSIISAVSATLQSQIIEDLGIGKQIATHSDLYYLS